MENPIKMDDLGVPLFLETPIYQNYKDSPLKGGISWHRLKYGELSLTQ